MVVDVIEEVEAESAHILFTHHCLVQDPGEDVTDDGAERKNWNKNKKRQKNMYLEWSTVRWTDTSLSILLWFTSDLQDQSEVSIPVTWLD